MWKVVLLGLYTVLAMRGLAKGAPFHPEEKWKPLDNPRNRDLIMKKGEILFQVISKAERCS